MNDRQFRDDYGETNLVRGKRVEGMLKRLALCGGVQCTSNHVHQAIQAGEKLRFEGKDKSHRSSGILI